MSSSPDTVLTTLSNALSTVFTVVETYGWRILFLVLATNFYLKHVFAERNTRARRASSLSAADPDRVAALHESRGAALERTERLYAAGLEEEAKRRRRKWEEVVVEAREKELRGGVRLGG